jgi:hypothetical protein
VGIPVPTSLHGAKITRANLVRQLQPRPVRDNMRLQLIIVVIGCVELARFLDHARHRAGTATALARSLVIAAAFGAIRAATVRVRVDGGKPGVRGT